MNDMFANQECECEELSCTDSFDGMVQYKCEDCGKEGEMSVDNWENLTNIED